MEQLFPKADDRMQEGLFDLANFLFSRTQKSIQELIVKSWMLKNASSEIQRDEITRIQKVRNAAVEACVDGCNGSWLECVIEVFPLNGMEVAGFASYMFELLAQGRGKFRNIMIYGQTNCAKTFMLKPLKCIFYVETPEVHPLC